VPGHLFEGSSTTPVRVGGKRLSSLGVSAVLHALGAMVAAWMAVPPPRGVSSDGEGSRSSIVVVHLADALPPASPDLRSTTTPKAFSDDLGIHLPDGESSLSLPGFKIDFGKVVGKAGALFPFLTGRLSLEKIVAARSRRERGRLVNPLGQRRGAQATKPPLTLRGRDLQQLLDKSWSRRDRWRAFQPIAEAAESHDADSGDLPTLLRSYVDQDGLQPYVDTHVRDPRLWTQLGLAADHAEFIVFISRYVSAHGATRTSTELLFLLDMLVQASFDALTVLLDSDPHEDLQWTRTANPDAYAAVIAIRDHYRAHLERLDLTSRDALRAYYDEARLSVLQTILDTTPNGYRAGDARFAIGGIYWKHGKSEDAVTAWRGITIDPRDRDVADYSDLLAEIGAGARTLDARRVNRILERQHSRWLSRSYDRVRQFGYHFDTF
jgi:hypothetical protein